MTLSKEDIKHATLPSRPHPSSTPTPTATMIPGPWAMDASKRNKLLKDYRTQVASASSTVLATLCVTPLENLKTRMQTHNFENLRECAKYLWRNEGIRGYTAGALPPLLSITFVRVVSFSAYQKVKYAISDGFERATGENPLVIYNRPDSMPTFSTVSTFVISGMAAGLATSPFACECELTKNVVQTSVLVAHKAQADPTAARNPNLYKMPRLGTFSAVQQILQRHGVRGLYTGYRLHAVRDTIGTGLYFGIYETTKQLISTYFGRFQSPFGPPMAAGALCSVIPWVLTYSLDTKKTRAQSVLLGTTKAMGEATMSVARSSMYRGLLPSIARTALQNMILLSSFEFIKIKINGLEV